MYSKRVNLFCKVHMELKERIFVFSAKLLCMCILDTRYICASMYVYVHAELVEIVVSCPILHWNRIIIISTCTMMNLCEMLFLCILSHCM